MKYLCFGFINTLTHWSIFYILVFNELKQSFSNFFAFLAAVSLSYFLNSKYTFKSKRSIEKYILFIVAMGLISYLVGAFSDNQSLNPIFTLLMFSIISLFAGFIVSDKFIFKEKSK